MPCRDEARVLTGCFVPALGQRLELAAAAISSHPAARRHLLPSPPARLSPKGRCNPCCKHRTQPWEPEPCLLWSQPVCRWYPIAEGAWPHVRVHPNLSASTGDSISTSLAQRVSRVVLKTPSILLSSTRSGTEGTFSIRPAKRGLVSGSLLRVIPPMGFAVQVLTTPVLLDSMSYNTQRPHHVDNCKHAEPTRSICTRNHCHPQHLAMPKRYPYLQVCTVRSSMLFASPPPSEDRLLGPPLARGRAAVNPRTCSPAGNMNQGPRLRCSRIPRTLAMYSYRSRSAILWLHVFYAMCLRLLHGNGRLKPVNSLVRPMRMRALRSTCISLPACRACEPTKSTNDFILVHTYGVSNALV
ncbi:hypothetical protein V8C44DRAFT_341422 [Trichoderma aethiopicum]